MYRPKVEVKTDPVKRWHQPDRQFFACGACQVLAHAFLEMYPNANYHAVWVKPSEGYRGSHVFVTDGCYTFDYHGYSTHQELKKHTGKRNKKYSPGWCCEYVDLDIDLSCSHEIRKIGMNMLTANEFLFDALPRAKRFVLRHAHRHLQNCD